MAITLIVDVGNTLLDTRSLYDHAEWAWSWMMQEAGFDGHACLAALRAYDRARMSEIGGDSRNRYPGSMRACYLRECEATGRAPDSALADHSWQIGDSVNTGSAPPFPGAIDALEALTYGYDVHLFTVGDHEVQAARIRAAGLRQVVNDNHVHMSGWKSPEALRCVLFVLGKKSQECIAIGDSLRNDIEPALACDLKRAVWTSGHTCWRGPIPDDPRLVRTETFGAVPDVLQALEETGTYDAW
jgi:putative hydrolase of the HAD superfamily